MAESKLGVGADEFNAWKHQPVSKVLLQFLEDYATAIRREANGAIETAANPIPPFQQGEIKGRVNTLTEIATLRFEHIEDFYRESEDGTKTDSD